MKLQFIGIEPSKNPLKKLDATFILPNGRTKIISFGASGMTDFTISPRNTPEEVREAIKRRRLYINRHSARENHRNPLTPGALSRWILWEKPTKEEAVVDFRRRFGFD